ncbi:hypothetical protein IH779_03290 [Patescibacteria group bacterium]|nr:hypothetical protein [Patescibacteria group bacterium]
MVTAEIPKLERSSTQKQRRIQIERFPNNPLIIPDPNSSWMNVAVFNCGVIKSDDGLYRMLFRATSRKDHQYSDIGLALSEDGKNWSVHDEPVLKRGFNQYCVRGIEDPRIIQWVDGWYYIFAAVKSAAVKSAGVRVGIFRTKDFFEYEWVGFSFNRIDRNTVVFPEPIGNFAFLIHRTFPHILISKSEGFGLDNSWQGGQILIRPKELYLNPHNGAKPWKIGIGPPPIRTPKGWLVLINVSNKESRSDPKKIYSLGFAVLDLHDPTKVNYIHPEPILWPTEEYETIGCVPNVCFCCAAVDTGGDDIYIYYGAADNVIAGGVLKKEQLVGICY